ncbi:MAG: type II toxin-antitoxin system HicA family toxin [Deltaproteobacteria bacterium]|nr:type II toxin-antitoxin system HicA family toxin [Deltaproteobacteria bacterium]MCB9488602.1 type II toxin-antitoxin system HicA family toxin [Deltaproteobacteria bacterium]
MSKTYKLRELEKILKDYDPLFEIIERRGKGSHRMIYHPNIDGCSVSFPVVGHGKNNDMKPYVIPQIIKRFKLPKHLFK